MNREWRRLRQEFPRLNLLSRSTETQDALSDKFYRDAEKATKERNVDMPAVNEAVRAARDVLLGVYRSNPKKAGDFGFTVNDSVKSNGNAEAAAATK